MANAFSTKGATTKPSQGVGGAFLGGAYGKNPNMTPQSKALQSVSSGAVAGSRPPTFTPPKDQAIKSYKAPDGSVQTYYPTNSAKASYSGGDKLPAVGSAEYKVSQALNTGTPQTGMVSPSTTGTTQAPQAPMVPTYGGLVGQLAQVSSQPSQQFADLTKQAQEARQKAANFGQAVAQKTADMQTNPEYSLDTGVGLGNRIAQTEGIKANALNATATGLENLAGLANTQQGLQQSGLQAAAGLAAPILGEYGQANYGLGGNTGGGSIQQNDPFYKTLQSYAQLRATGQESLIPSSITGNPVLNAQLTDMTRAINPNYNANVASAQGQIQGQQYGQVQNLTSALQQGQNLQAQLTDLITTFGLNPNDVNAANVGLQAIARNTSDARYQMLQNYINDIANTYAQILTPAGGAQTDTTRGIAASMLDSSAKGQGIIDVMRGLDEAAKAKIAGVQTIRNQPTAPSGPITWDNVFDN